MRITRARRLLGLLFGSLAPIVVILVVLLVLLTARQPDFLSPPSLMSFLGRSAPVMLLAAGQYFVIVSGELDLSVGSLVTAQVVVAARLIDGDPSAGWPVAVLLFAFGAAVGLVNGLVTTRLRVPSFITTLGMFLILVGAVYLWSDGAPKGSLSEGFRRLGRSGFENVPVLERIPYALLVLLAMAALALAASGALAYILARSLTVPLREAISVLRRIRGGNYRVQLPVTTGGEVGELQASIGEMSVALDQSKQDLENKVAERTRDLLASRNEALRADADKRKLIQKVNSIIEDERKSIAVEIHDELNASLIAVRLESQTIQQLAAKATPGEEIDQIRAKAQAITKLALDLYANGRRLVRRLRPEVLDMLGLHGAVEEMVSHYRSSTGLHFEFESQGDFSKIGNELAISAYRIVQEALSNIMKHSKAGFARVSLVLSDEDEALHIDVQDDGEGFDPAVASEGIGIIGMRERVFALGGSIHVQSRPGEGTLVAITLPLSDVATA